MVKPPRTMQPEGVNLKKAGRAAGRAFQDDSFRNYMARKIDLQRKQFGVQLPPPPPPPPPPQQSAREEDSTSNLSDQKLPAREAPAKVSASKPRARVSFAPPDNERQEQTTERPRKKRKKTGMMSVIERLKRRHGKARDLVTTTEAKAVSEIPPVADPCAEQFMTQLPSAEPDHDDAAPFLSVEPTPKQSNVEKSIELLDLTGTNKSPTEQPNEQDPSVETDQQQSSLRRALRPDLFFLGVVVIINGYTHPDAESLQRLLQQHGGDVERYETSRVTHVIAEHLSMAKAKIYARQRKPTPVVHPSWIVNCVKEKRLVPHAPYLIREVRNLQQQPSVATFFQKAPPAQQDQQTPQRDVESERGWESSGERNQNISHDSLRKDIHDAVQLSGGPGESVPEATLKNVVHNPYSLHDKGAVGVADFSSPQKFAAAASSILDKRPSPSSRTDDKYIDGQIRTVGTDPNFLETFFAQSRLSFIGSFRQRACGTSSVAAFNPKDRRRPSNRYVLHIDMDSFFAAVVLRNYPEYVNKPVAICHFGKSCPDSAEMAYKESTSECATINYEARKFGLKKGMYLGRARALCPSLIVLPYDFQGYQEVSEQVSDICHQYAGEHFGAVEAVSCDESYMEVFVDSAEIVSQLAEDIRRDIFEATRCTATVGVAKNKFLAKLATDKVKPNGCYLAANYVDLLRNLQLRDLHGIGYRSEPKLTGKGFVSVQDVWDRGDAAEGELQAILGKQLGTKIYNFCRGKDDRPVQAADRKTIGAECNYGVRFDGPYGVDYMIEGLCKEVQKRMEHVGITGAKVTLKVKQRKEGAKPPPKFLGHGSCHNLSKSLDCSRPTRQWDSFAPLCMKMFKDMKVKIEDVRGMGVIVSKLVVDGAEPARGIKSFFQTRQMQEAQVVGSHRDDREDEPLVETEQGQTEIDSHAHSNVDLVETHAETEQGPEIDSHALSIIDLVESDNEENDSSPIGGSQEYFDGNHDDSFLLSQSSGSSAGLEDSGRKKNRHSLDSLHDIGFVTVLEKRRRSMDAFTETAENADEDEGTPEKFEDDEGFAKSSTERTNLSNNDGEAMLEDPSQEDSFEDIALPSLSQLHMSQIEFLPTQMRKKIHSKIEASRAVVNKATHVPVPKKVDNPPETRYRQTDVGRMMRLAAVKAGCADSEATLDISMTQLNRLPMEVQLQVANNDMLSIGIPSPRKKTSGSSSSSRSRKAGTSKSKLPSSKPPPASRRDTRKKPAITVNEHQPASLNEREFFQENILPLSTFLDACCVTEENVSIIKDFFQNFVAEYSWYEVALLLRSIRRRKDGWSKAEAIDPIFFSLNERFRSEAGVDLDIG